MSRPRMNIAADIPLDLADADEALTLYGRWAADRESRRRCGLRIPPQLSQQRHLLGLRIFNNMRRLLNGEHMTTAGD